MKNENMEKKIAFCKMKNRENKNGNLKKTTNVK